AVGEAAPLRAYYRVPEPGQYVVRLRAAYANGVTADTETGFQVAAASGSGPSAPEPVTQLPPNGPGSVAGVLRRMAAGGTASVVGGVAALAALLVVAAVIVRRHSWV
ncbi:MAG: hypothetical protein ACYC5O_14305, partial [Anaerolineae bacterium]